MNDSTRKITDDVENFLKQVNVLGDAKAAIHRRIGMQYYHVVRHEALAQTHYSIQLDIGVLNEHEDECAPLTLTVYVGSGPTKLVTLPLVGLHELPGPEELSTRIRGAVTAYISGLVQAAEAVAGPLLVQHLDSYNRHVLQQMSQLHIGE